MQLDSIGDPYCWTNNQWVDNYKSIPSKVLKFLAFNIWNIALYNTPNIKTSIFLLFYLNIIYLLIFYSSPLSLSHSKKKKKR